jgi:hypothetical protein
VLQRPRGTRRHSALKDNRSVTARPIKPSAPRSPRRKVGNAGFTQKNIGIAVDAVRLANALKQRNDKTPGQFLSTF